MHYIGTFFARSVRVLKSASRHVERIRTENLHLCARLSARPDFRNQGYGEKKWTYEEGVEEKGLRLKANQECVMHLNKAIAPSEPERHRSEYPNWSFEAELYAFGQRLGEEFDEGTLRKALQDSSHAEKQLAREKKVGLESNASLGDNSELASLGLEIIENYTKAYLRTHFPNLPEEGCSHICGYLTSDLVSAHIGRNIGLADLVLCDQVKPVDRILAKCLHAVVGALALSTDVQRAQGFVLDILVAQLASKDLFELIDPEITSLDLLRKIFESHMNSSLEPRIIRSTGSGTILSVFNVGIYSDKDPDGAVVKTFVGSGFGETLDIAVDMAAKDSLRSFFGLHPGVRLVHGREARKLSLDFDARNWSIGAL